MNLNQINDRIIEIQTKIGKVRTSRNLCAFGTVCLVGAMGVTMGMVIDEPSKLTALLLAASSYFAGVLATTAGQKQSEIRHLKDEKETLLIEKSK